MQPTWDNDRIDGAYITKILDRFLLHVGIIDRFGMPKSFNEIFFISDHRPISLKWKEQNFRSGYPFKFNRTWLVDPDFNDLIRRTWAESPPLENLFPSMSFIEKLSSIRSIVMEWKYRIRLENRKELRAIQNVA